jgi:hypothetical protein
MDAVFATSIGGVVLTAIAKSVEGQSVLRFLSIIMPFRLPGARRLPAGLKARLVILTNN